jgi:cytochrome c oxidase subunit 3/cytochrome o ubiquinol oxidase subunit 3
MLCLITAESAVFVIFVVAYLFYVGQSLSGPMPRDVLELPIFISICLLASSPTISAAVRALERGHMAAFKGWWRATIVLGGIFLAGTAREWYLLNLPTRQGMMNAEQPVRRPTFARRAARRIWSGLALAW